MFENARVASARELVIAKIVIGVALIAAACIIPFAAPGVFAAMGAFALGTFVAIGMTGLQTLIQGIQGLGAHPITSQLTVREPVSFRRIVYGQPRVAGVMTYVATSGVNNDYLHVLLTLSGHQLSAIGNMYTGGLIALPLGAGSPGNMHSYPDYFALETNLGRTDTGQPYPGLAANITDWNSNCLQQECAGAHVTLLYDATRYPSGMPSSFAFDVKGKAVYDPRTGTTAYSRNPALCVRDYICDKTFGMGVVTPDQSANFKGIYASGTSYVASQIASDGSGNYYTCILASTGNPFTNITYWSPLASLVDDTVTVASANICDEQVEIAPANVATIGTITQVIVISGIAFISATNNLKVGQEVTFSGLTYATFLNGLTLTVIDVGAATFYGHGTGSYNAGQGFACAVSYSDFAHVDSGSAVMSAFQPRYTCDGMVDAGQTRGAVLTSLLQSMMGYAIPPGDAWRIYAGAYRTPTLILTQDDLRGPIKLDTLRSKRDLVNGVKGTFVSPATNWQQSDFPPYVDSTYVTADGGQHIWGDLTLAYTTDGIAAQRLAKIYLERNRRQKSLTLPCKLSALPLQPGDTMMFSFDTLGFNEKIFEVQSASIVMDASSHDPYTMKDSGGGHMENIPVLGVDLLLQETDSNVYSWNYATDENTWLVPNPTVTLVPNPLVCQPPTGVTVTSGSAVAMVRGDGIIQDRILVQWTSPTDIFVLKGGSIEIYTSPHGAGTWSLAGTADGSDTQFYALNCVDGAAYDVLVYAVNNAGVDSAGVEVANIVASGGTTTFGGIISTIPASQIAALVGLTAYNGATAYTVGMKCTYAGNVYQSVLASTGIAPPNATYWTLVGPATLDNVTDGTTYPRTLPNPGYGQNVIENSGFETPPAANSADNIFAGWAESANGSAGQGILIAEQLATGVFASFSGNYSCLINLSGSASLPNGQSWGLYMTANKRVPVLPGQIWTLSGWTMNSVSALPSGVTAGLNLVCRTYFSDGTNDGGANAINLPQAEANWTNHTVTFAVANPVGKQPVSIRVEVQCQLTNASGSAQTIQSSTMNCRLSVDSLSLVRVSNLDTETVDGASRFARTAAHSSYRPTSNPLTSTDNGTSPFVNVAAFTQRVAGTDVAVSSGSVSGTAGQYGQVAFISYLDPTLAGGAVTYNLSTTRTDALSGTGRFYTGSVTLPKSGGSNRIGYNDGGVGAQYSKTVRILPATYATGGTATWTNPSNALDDDTSTKAIGVTTTGGGSATYVASGYPSFSSWFSTNILTVLHQFYAITGTGWLEYSTNGAGSWTALRTVTTADAAPVTTTAALGLNTNSNQVQVRFTLPGGGGTGSGTGYDGTAANDTAPASGLNWTNPTNAEGNQTSTYANVTKTTGTGFSYYLKMTNLGFALPSTATPTGISATVTCRSNYTDDDSGDYRYIYENSVMLYKAGAVAGADKSTGAMLPTSTGTMNYGGSTDLWGTTWAYTDINNTGFGLAFSVNLQNGGTIFNASADVYNVAITVYYTTSGGSGSCTCYIYDVAQVATL